MTRKTSGTRKAPEPEGRKKSKLTLAAEETMRTLLLKTLRAHDWNLTATAEELELNGSGNVIRAIRSLGLTEEYEAARTRGDVKPGPRGE